PKSGKEVQKDSTKIAINQLFTVFKEKVRFYVLFPIPHHEQQGLADELQVLKEKGFTRLLNIETEQIIDLTTGEIDPGAIIPKKYRVLVDRLVLKTDEDTQSRIAGSLETAFQEGHDRCSLKIRSRDLEDESFKVNREEASAFISE